MLNTLLNISYLMYIFNAMPFELRNLNYLEIFNECFILLISYLLLGFSDWIQDVDSKIALGYVLTYLILLNIGINLSIIAY